MSRAETTKTVLVAGTADFILAIAKLIAGTLAGSSAMLAEGAHSVADTLNQGLLEGTSWVRAYTQARRETRENGRDIVEHVRRSPDVTFKAALFEDTAAMIGLAFAAAGLVLRQLTGSQFWDGLASVLIGLLLVVVAVVLGRDSKGLIIGRAADPAALAEIRAEIAAAPGVTGVDDLLTMHFGPDELLVAARVHFSDAISADQAEDVAGEIDRRLKERVPIVRHVFLDPTQRTPAPRRRRRAGVIKTTPGVTSHRADPSVRPPVTSCKVRIRAQSARYLLALWLL
ncbi:hypothetical protein F8568_042680 [Actinomadura sp. LD22]|uniref:Uncharacterized protein n=1 Tax=Actinomadura physcomitrii TaxID=2650748 RepID=A0A6I4MSV7_9ACTN|nr:cation transporter [Actinomadura physcomitrii]MWA06937.1 hypothetical protein [Actinomadura physcomitrii]